MKNTTYAKDKVAVIIAAYNEEKHIKDVVHDTQKEGYPFVIVINDGSADRTTEEAQKAGATVLEHITNLGKGGALKTGAEYAIRNGAEALVFLDGDGQHEPKDISRVLSALSTCDIVFTARKREGHMPFVLRFGNWFLTTYIKILYGLKLHDSQCGFRAVRVTAYPQIVWRSNSYAVESEIVAWAGKAHLSYKEVHIRTIYHDQYKGTTPLDGLPIAWNLLVWRFLKRKGRRKTWFSASRL